MLTTVLVALVALILGVTLGIWIGFSWAARQVWRVGVMRMEDGLARIDTGLAHIDEILKELPDDVDDDSAAGEP